MPPHSSLSAPYSGAPPLKAQAEMRRNEQCWCGQGLKWKNCHRDRELQPPTNAFHVDADARWHARRGRCSHSPDGVGCGGGIARSHTVQRNGGLRAIAEGKSRVLTVKHSMKALIEHGGNPPPKEIGIGEASVFPGFCGVHDHDVFQPIEGGTVVVGAPEAPLFAYRAIAYERFAKSVQVANAPIQRQMDRGTPLRTQEAIQNLCRLAEAGAKRGLAEVEVRLDECRRRVVAGDFSDVRFRAYRFDALLPLVCCGGFMPEISVDGILLQRLARGTDALEHLTLTITAYDGRSVAVFAWIGGEDGPAGRYVETFDALADGDKADALVQIAFEQLDNIFLRVSWWQGLPPEQRADLTRRILSGIGLQPHQPGFYARSAPLLTTAAPVECVGNVGEVDAVGGPAAGEAAA